MYVNESEHGLDMTADIKESCAFQKPASVQKDASERWRRLKAEKNLKTSTEVLLDS